MSKKKKVTKKVAKKSVAEKPVAIAVASSTKTETMAARAERVWSKINDEARSLTRAQFIEFCNELVATVEDGADAAHNDEQASRNRNDEQESARGAEAETEVSDDDVDGDGG